MDERRTQIRERAGLEESRLNEDFIDFLRRWGTPVLLVLAVGSVGWMLRGRYKASQEARVDNAFIEFEAVRGSAPSPEQLIGVAEDYGDVRSVGMLARLEAADAYVEAIRRGVRTGATINTDGTLPKPEEALTEADRADYIQRAGDLYAQVLSQAQAKAGHEVLVVGALYGQASVAEMSKQWDKAKENYQRAAEIADRVQFTGLASVARARIANLDQLKVEPKVYTAAEVPTIPALPGQEPIAVPSPAPATEAAPAPAPETAPAPAPEPAPAGEPAPTPAPK